MSERTAKTYTHVSNRANPQKKQEKERKVVFKSVLDNPFRVRWPSVPVNLQNLILAQVLLLVEGVSAHKPCQRHNSNHHKNYGRKRKADNNAPTESSTVSSTEINSDILVVSVSIDAAAVPKRRRDGNDDQGSEKKKKRKTDAFVSVPTTSPAPVDSSIANTPVSTVNSKRRREVEEEQRGEKKQKTTLTEDAFVPSPPTNVHSTERSNGDSGDPPADISDHADIPLPSPILKNLVVGINAVTKRLECQIQAASHKVVISSSSSTEESYQQPQPLKYIFVCRTDVDPPILIDHIPHLVASFNSCKPFEPIKLIPLPKGTEATL
ncbi:hypothetical protein IW261DRAFT_1511180, partial [Armillaria novae-zelandiae]